MSALRPDDPENLLAQSNWLRRLARGLVRDEDAAEDLAQDTWVAALRARPAELRSWMTVVARNFARRGKRDAGLRAAHESRAARDERVESPDEIAARVELQRKLAEALLALDEPFRSALVLRYLDGLSTIQVAEKLGLSHDAARQRISRALAKLRERLDREHEHGRAGWMSALVPFAHAPKVSITGGLLLMGTKTKLAAALAVAALGLWIWKGPLSPTALEPEAAPGAVAPLAAEVGNEIAERTPLEASKTSSRTEVLIPTIASRIADPAPANVLRGIVLDPKDRPVEGAHIVATSSISYDYQTLDLAIATRDERVGETQSSADGRFELPLDPARCYQLTVSRSGYAPATLGRRHPGETVVVHLPYGAAIEGRVTQGEAKVPVASARVRCFLRGNDSPDGARFEQASVTDANGNYRIDALPPGILFLEASATGLPMSDWIEVHPEAGKTITQDVNLVAEAWFRGHVLDARTRAPIAGAELGTIWVLRNSVRTDPSGAFSLPLDKGSDGQIYVRAAGYGFRNVTQPAGTGESSAADIEILLEPARRASGRVTNEQGQPIAGAYVAGCGTDYGEVQRHDWVGTTTDAQGRYALADLRPDLQHSLFVRAQGFGSSVYEFPATEKTQAVLELEDVVLRSAGAIRGRVVDENSRPLPDLSVKLRGVNTDRGRWDSRDSSFLDSYVGRREGRTDDRGAFTFDELAAGEYVVELRRDGHQTAGAQSVSLKSGERREAIELVLPNGVELPGFVHDSAGKPVAGVNVSIEPTAPGLSDCDVQTGVDGRFLARGLIAGVYRIQLWPYDSDVKEPDKVFHVHTLFENVQVDGHELDLVIEDGVWLHGVVLESDGTPVGGANLTADAGSEYQARGTSDAQGRFRIAVEHGKSLTVVARDPPGSRRDEHGQWVNDETRGNREVRLDGAVGGPTELRIQFPPR
ncbi:MAG: sigma-70 family RNA polymerase sigma factor [Planctomycetes bacterium]|nr:sigma-70 family RNA polymerase sigma factor [Planctomycetota bacterium]